MSNTRFGILHLVDSLAIGGTERVAVNLVNHLPRERYRPYLCTTRHEGPLAREVALDVGRLSLKRRHTLDTRALQQLIRFVRREQIQLLHAHSTTLFLAAIASMFPPFPAVIWHDHYGRFGIAERSALLYRLVIQRMRGVIAVNQPLADWSRQRLRVSSDRVWYVPNFSCLSREREMPADLPGTPGSRIVCVANLRPQKDHPTLLHAMVQVKQLIPHAQLLLVGSASGASYRDMVTRTIVTLGLDHHVTWLGQRDDVADILRASDIGVLSSVMEGLPLALIEYGMAGLPVVATQVGQCAEVLDNGNAGLLVSPTAPEELADGIVQLLRSPDRRALLGDRLRRRVEAIYSAEAIIGQVCAVYEQVLKDSVSLATF